MPVRIGVDAREGHLRVAMWISACLVLHNFLHSQKEEWPYDNNLSTQESDQSESSSNTTQTEAAEARAGKIRRDELVHRVQQMNR